MRNSTMVNPRYLKELESERDTLRASLDEAQGDARAFEATADRLQGELDRMTTSRDEAVALLRRIYQDTAPNGEPVDADPDDIARYAVDYLVLPDARAFLARIDGKGGA